MKKIWIAIPALVACSSSSVSQDAGTKEAGSIPSGALICQATASSGGDYYACDAQYRSPSDPHVDCTSCGTTNSCDIGDVEAGEYGTGYCSHAP